MEKKLGKIQEVTFGHGGYQEAMIGVSFTLGGEGWGVGDFWGNWSLDRSENAKWSEEDRINGLGKMVMKINKLLNDSNKHSVSDLEDVPVEVIFNGNSLVDWRILTEVIK